MGYQLFSDMTADVSEALMRGMPEVAYVPMQVELGGESFTYGPGGSLTVGRSFTPSSGRASLPAPRRSTR